ncbi:MAG: alpha/beta hydrolase family protein [Gemmatimonadales bacterium]
MATPSLTRHRLPGYLGEILIDVRTGDRSRPRPAVLVLHGFKGFKDWGMFPPFAERLAKAGFTTVSFNLSGSGVDDTGDVVFPDRFARATFSGDLGDIGRVIEAVATGALDAAPPTSIGFLGHSRGGGLGVLAAAADSRVAALVTWAAISSVNRYSLEEVATWRATGKVDIVNSRTGQVLPMYTDALDDAMAHGKTSLDIRAAASRMSAPWLIVHGTADAVVPLAEAEALHAAGGEGTELLTVPGAGHTFGAVHPWQGPTPEFTGVADASIRFFAKHLLT